MPKNGANDAYESFLKSKALAHEAQGLEPQEPHPSLFDFQRDIVMWALRRGRACIFADCGMGKSRMQIEWAAQIPGDVLIVAPLNVAQQTISEGKAIGREIRYCRKDSEIQAGLTIINYEMLEKIDVSRFSGVVLDECFAPGTMIECFNNGVAYYKDIRYIRENEKIKNASGIDTVKECHRRKVEKAVKITFCGKSVICSENHPWFTQNGWTPAWMVRKTDRLLETREAMRMVQGDVRSEKCNGGQEAFLREILLSEMAYEQRGFQGSDLHSRTTSQDYSKNKGVAQFGSPQSRRESETTSCIESDEQSRVSQESEPRIEINGPQTFRTWRKREGHDVAAIAAIGGTTEWMGERVCLVTGAAQGRLSNLLQARFSQPETKDQYRDRWGVSSFPQGDRREEGCDAGFVRVESVQILERGNPELEQFSDANGDIYFYDIGLKRHPSFSIEGVLVHNSSIIKAQDSKTRNLVLEMFAKTPYRLACTATPSPNDHMELGNHAEFVGAMSRTEMLSMFFVHDGGETQKWRLKGHAEKEFWRWVCTWAVMIRKPSDLGYEDGAFKLPPLNMIEHVVQNNGTPLDGNLFAMPALTLQERRGARSASLNERVALAASLAKESDQQWFFWCNLNSESEALTKAIGAREVRGSTTMEERQEVIDGFLSGKIRHVVSKASIFGFGLNLQACHNTACVGLSDSYEELYQLLRRFWRFGQTQPVNAHIIISDMEGAVLKNIKRKEKDADKMAQEMVRHMSKINQAEIKGTVRTVNTYEEDVCEGDGFIIHLNDCVKVASGIASESIDYSIFSPPFRSLYTYSASERDMGNSKNPDEFAAHYQFLMREMFRVTKPGRLMSFHCMNLPTSKTHDGYIGIHDFRGELIKGCQAEGFIFHSEVCIWKDPVTAMQRTKAIGLLHKQMVKDSAMSRQGIPDYLVTVRKPGENKEPVEGELDRWIGEEGFTSNGRLSIDLWQRYASPVWMDINPSKTLSKESARDEKDERHIAPLQLQVIERGIELWSNPGDLVFSPFTGIGSEGFVAIQTGRRFIGAELKRSYWAQACANIQRARAESLEFDMMATP
jgi:superfamily II DNA or RNA helicase